MGKFNYDQNDFEKVKREAEEFYSKIGEVWCPYFKENIAFNAKGIRHLKFKSDERARLEKDQYARLKLLHYVPDVIKNSRTVQGIDKRRDFEKEKNNGEWRYAMKDIVFFEFIAVMANVRIKIIVKEVFGGEKHFWSVIPFWKIDKENGKRILCGSDTLED